MFEHRRRPVEFFFLGSHLLLQLSSLDLLEFGDFSQRLGAQDAAARVLSHFVVAVVEVGLAHLDELTQRCLVLRVHVGERERGSGLAAHDLTKASLAFNDAVRHAHFLAQSWQIQNDLEKKIEIILYKSKKNIYIFQNCFAFLIHNFNLKNYIFKVVRHFFVYFIKF